MGKTEALGAWLSTLAFAGFAAKTMPPDQALFAWSVAGTVAGAVLGGLHLKQAGWLQRVVRMATCFFSGLLLAPYAIAQLPKAGTTPDWWHAFAASGISAAVGWILVDEAGPWVHQWVKARRGKR